MLPHRSTNGDRPEVDLFSLAALGQRRCATGRPRRLSELIKRVSQILPGRELVGSNYWEPHARYTRPGASVGLRRIFWHVPRIQNTQL